VDAKGKDVEDLENHENAVHANHSGAKHVALLIAILAAALAVTEKGGKTASTEVQTQAVEAADYYAFYQAKTIRADALKLAAESLELAGPADAALSARRAEAIEGWRTQINHLDSNPAEQKGRKELLEKAREAEHRRDEAQETMHGYEYGAAAFQLGIVLATASIITSTAALFFGAAGLGLIGLAFALVSWLAPHLLPLVL